MKLFKSCVQNNWGLLFLAFFASFINIVELMLYYKKFVLKAIRKQMKWVFSIVLLMLHYKKGVFKANRNLLFILLSYFCNIKNVCSKQAGSCFQFMQLLLQYEKNGGGYFFNPKNRRSKQGGVGFQFIKLLLQYEKCMFKKVGAASQFIKLRLFKYFCN